MDLNNRNDDWMKEAPKLAETGNSNPFTVPADYFETMQEQLQGRITIEQLKEENFLVPDRYFDTLGERILLSVKTEQLLQETKQSGFIVPQDYFAGLEEKIISRTIAESKNSRKPVRRLIPSWLNYAAAACIAIFIGVGVFLNQQNSSIDSKLSKIPEEDIVSYLQIHSDSGDLPVIVDNIDKQSIPNVEQGMSKQEIEQYLESTL